MNTPLELFHRVRETFIESPDLIAHHFGRSRHLNNKDQKKREVNIGAARTIQPGTSDHYCRIKLVNLESFPCKMLPTRLRSGLRSAWRLEWFDKLHRLGINKVHSPGDSNWGWDRCWGLCHCEGVKKIALTHQDEPEREKEKSLNADAWQASLEPKWLR